MASVIGVDVRNSNFISVGVQRVVGAIVNRDSFISASIRGIFGKVKNASEHNIDKEVVRTVIARSGGLFCAGEMEGRNWSQDKWYC